MSAQPLLLPTVGDLPEDFRGFLEELGEKDGQAVLDACRLPAFAMSPVCLSLTTVCNYNCPFCFNHADKFYGYYKPRTFKAREIIDLVRKNPPLHELAFSVAGEPFLNPEVFTIMEALSDRVNQFIFSTNAGLLTPEKSRRLAEFRIGRVVLSAEGATPADYAKYRAGGDLDVFRTNARALSAAIGRDKVWLLSVLFSENAEALKAMPDLAADVGASTFGVQVLRSHDLSRSRGLTAFEPERLQDYLFDMIERCKRAGVRMHLDNMLVDLDTATRLNEALPPSWRISTEAFYDPCPIASTQMLIDPEGAVGFCCAMPAFPVDGLNRPFIESFNSPQALMMRAMSYAGRHPRVCREYCHKLDRPEAPSLELIRSRVRDSQGSMIPYREVGSLPAGRRLALRPYGSLAKVLEREGFFSASTVVARLDRNAQASDEPGVRVLPPERAFELGEVDYVITSQAYRFDILLELIRQPEALTGRVYYVDEARRVYEYMVEAVRAAG